MTFRFTFDELGINPDELAKGTFRDFTRKEMSNQLKRLETKLARGKDADLKPVKKKGDRAPKYAGSYVKQMLKGPVQGTRGKFNKRPSTVNLTVSGGLKASRRVSGSPKDLDEAILDFSGGFRGGGYKQLAKDLYSRGFTGWMKFSNRDIEIIEKRFVNEFDKILKKLVEIKRNNRA